MPNTELTALQRSIDELRQTMSALRERYGDTPAVRRIANDIERLEIDAAELAGGRITPMPRHAEMVVVPDTPYDPQLWDGADDEGVGGYRPHGR